MKSKLPLNLPVVLLAFATLETNFAQAQAGDIDQQYGAAQRALTSGNYREAEREFEQLAQSHPGVAEIHSNLGLIYFQERRFELAVQELRRALKLKAALTNSAEFLAMSLSELGRFKEALPGLQKGFHSSDREMKRMCGLQLERAYTGLGQDAKAVEIALEMHRLFSDDPEVIYNNGKIFGNFAFLSMQRLPQIAPDSVWTHQASAEAYESQGSYPSAIAQYRQVLRLDPARIGIHYRLGRTLLAQGRATNSAEDVNSAIAEFNEELKLDPLNASAAYEIGEIHRSAGEFGDAQKYFELALKSYPDFGEAHLGLANVLSQAGESQSALTHVQKAIALDSENEVAWYRLSRVEHSLGNLDEAQRALAKFHELHNRKTAQRQSSASLFSSEEVTKQTVDPNTAQ